MIGVGPFLTLPFMVKAMGGPHILYAWVFGAVLALCDGLVYAELGAALPGSGGPYVYLREAYRPFGLGRLAAFVFIFQVMLVAPLSIAGGAVGFADYLGFYWKTMGPMQHNVVAAALCVVVTALLYRDIASVGRLAVLMLIIVLATVGWVIVAGVFKSRGRRPSTFHRKRVRFDGGLVARTRRGRARSRCTTTAATTTSATSATSSGSRTDDAARDRPVDRGRRRPLRRDEHRRPRHRALARGGVRRGRSRRLHRPHVLGSRRPVSRQRWR